MKITAVEEKIVVKQLIKNLTKGGLIIPGNAKAEPQVFGKVISVGPQVQLIKEGDLIMFHQKGGMAVVLDNSMYLVVKSDEVYAIIEDEELEKQLSEMTLGG